MDFGAIIMGFACAFLIKGVVMLLAAILLVRLYRISCVDHPKRPWLLIPEEERHQFRFLTIGLFFFLFSELTCGVEVYILSRSSVVLGCIHGIVSALAMGFTLAGFFEVFDHKLLHFVDTSRPCFAVKICKLCTKRSGDRCNFRNLLLMLASLVVLLILPVFWLSTERINADPRPYILPFESWNIFYDFTVVPWVSARFPNVMTDGSAFYIPGGVLTLEYRILPLVAICISIVSIILTLRKKEDWAVYAMLAALGVSGYVFFEALVYGMTRDAYFGSLLHELGELCFLVLAIDLLQILFKPTS